MPASTTFAQEAERQFLRAFFHDLAAALSGVSLQVELAHRRGARGEDAGGAISEARAALSRALRLFERARELLIRSPAQPEAFDFDAWVDETVALCGVVGPVGGRTGRRVQGDRGRLSAALAALLANAAEAAAPDAIAIERAHVNGQLRVAVTNPGRLPESDPERLFSPRASREESAWGFGLPTARLFAAEAGGGVTLRQEGDRVVATLELSEETRA